MIARAEQRRERLEYLSEMSIALAKEIAVRYMDGPYHPEPRTDVGRSHAAVVRSVRLTYAMQRKIDEEILALCEGKSSVEASRAPRPTSAGETPADQDAVPAPLSADPDPDFEARERLTEYERPDPADVTETPPSTEVGRADSRRQAASRVGFERDTERLDDIAEDDGPERSEIPPTRSHPEGGSRPPLFGGGRRFEARVEGDADPPPDRE